jgi:hypothetical protein
VSTSLGERQWKTRTCRSHGRFGGSPTNRTFPGRGDTCASAPHSTGCWPSRSHRCRGGVHPCWHRGHAPPASEEAPVSGPSRTYSRCSANWIRTTRQSARSASCLLGISTRQRVLLSRPRAGDFPDGSGMAASSSPTCPSVRRSPNPGPDRPPLRSGPPPRPPPAHGYRCGCRRRITTLM